MEQKLCWKVQQMYFDQEKDEQGILLISNNEKIFAEKARRFFPEQQVNYSVLELKPQAILKNLQQKQMKLILKEL